MSCRYALPNTYWLRFYPSKILPALNCACPSTQWFHFSESISKKFSFKCTKMYAHWRLVLMYICFKNKLKKKWKQSQWSSKTEQLNKLWHIHAVEYYTTIKKNKVKLNGPLEKYGITLSEKSKLYVTEQSVYLIPCI